jgi:hypothetical protein
MSVINKLLGMKTAAVESAAKGRSAVPESMRNSTRFKQAHAYVEKKFKNATKKRKLTRDEFDELTFAIEDYVDSRWDISSGVLNIGDKERKKYQR